MLVIGHEIKALEHQYAVLNTVKYTIMQCSGCNQLNAAFVAESPVHFPPPKQKKEEKIFK